MEIDVKNDLYAYSEKEKELTKNITEHNGIQFCGFPSSGKARVIKKIIWKNNLENFYTVIDLTMFCQKGGFDFSNEKLNNYLSLKYAEGVRIFHIKEINLDEEYMENLLTQLENFRHLALERISLILNLTADLDLYIEKFSGNSALSYKQFYQSVGSEEYFNKLIKSNDSRFETKLPDSNYAELYELTGGIPALIKRYYELFIKQSDCKIETEYNNLVKTLLGSITLKELITLKGLNEEACNVLLKQGIMNNSKEIISSLIKNNIIEYIKYNEYLAFQNKIYVNGISISKYLTFKENEFLISLSKNKIVNKYDIKLSEEKEFSLYAIDKFISRLREKLKAIGVNPYCFDTVKGVGYSLIK